MNVARSFPSVAVFNGHIYVAGGRKSDSVRVDAVELFDPANGDWLQVASMKEVRCTFALFKSNMFLYAVGANSAVERYDALKPCWTKVGSLLRVHYS